MKEIERFLDMKDIESFLDNYKSPIEIIGEQINSNFENGILKAVHSFGIDVDIEELKRALKYDRNQYMQGYEFGRKKTAKEFAERLKQKYAQSCSEYYPELIMLTSEQLNELLKEYEK